MRLSPTGKKKGAKEEHFFAFFSREFVNHTFFRNKTTHLFSFLDDREGRDFSRVCLCCLCAYRERESSSRGSRDEESRRDTRTNTFIYKALTVSFCLLLRFISS